MGSDEISDQTRWKEMEGCRERKKGVSGSRGIATLFSPVQPVQPVQPSSPWRLELRRDP